MLCAIPIETVVRELDGALYQALHLAAKGLPSLVGGNMALKMALIHKAPVVLFDNDHYIEGNDRVLKAGGAVINIDPEGLGVRDYPTLVDEHAKTVPHVSLMSAWGEDLAEAIRSKVSPEYQNRVQAFGHPSFDLAHSRFTDFYKSQAIIDKHGNDYIQVNANFGFYNQLVSIEQRMEAITSVYGEDFIETAEHKQHVENCISYQKDLLEAFLEMIRFLAARYPDRHIIVRPHPAENTRTYTKALDDISNVYINNTGAVRTWIASAGAVIHHACTTGIETLLMGKLIIQYRPFFDPEKAPKIPSKVGAPVESLEELAEFIDKGTMPQDLIKEQRNYLRQYFASINHNTSKTLAQFAFDSLRGADQAPIEKCGMDTRMKCWTKYVGKRLRALRPGDKGKRVQYILQKFDRIKLSQVSDTLERIGRCEPSLPSVQVTEVCMDTFFIEPKAH